MPFARVNDQDAMAARGGEHRAAGRNRRLQARYVVAERGAEAAGFEEIALHIDDHQRRPIEINAKRRRFGLKSHARHFGPPITTPTDVQKQGQHSRDDERARPMRVRPPPVPAGLGARAHACNNRPESKT